MKQIGKGICVLGSIAAILFPPYIFLGSRHWGFIFGDIVSFFGNRVSVYSHIDAPMLLLELAVINGIGGALIYLAGRK